MTQTPKGKERKKKKMKKIEFVAKATQYTEYAKTVDVHQKPTVGVNSGAHGATFEMAVKMALGNTKGNHLKSKAGNVDTRKKRQNVEIKSGAGELAKINELGKVSGLINGFYDLESDELQIENIAKGWVIYAPEYTPGQNVENVSYVMTAEDFVKAILQAGMLRKKLSTAGKKSGKTAPDRLTLQSFTNSIKKSNAWYDALEDFGMGFSEWVEMIK